MEKEKELKRMTTELPVYAINATMKLTKGQNLAKLKDWSCGNQRTEKRLPVYSNKGIYIPKFENMDYDTVMLQRQLYE